MRSIALIIGACLFLLKFNGCSKEDIYSGDKNLIGIWFEEEFLEDYDHISRLQYHFKDDDSLEILRIEVEKDSREILGYRFRSFGNYRLAGDQLTFYNFVSYTNDDTQGSYTEIDSLKILDYEEDSYTVTYKIEEGGNKLIIIYPPCGPAANCIGSKTLIREREIY